MQEYMIEKNKEFAPEITETVPDEAVVSFRKIIKNKKTKKEEKTEEKPQEELEHTSVFSYAATACLVLAVLAVGAGFYRNYMGLTDLSRREATVTVTSDEIVQEEEKATPPITWIEEKQIQDETAESQPTATPQISEAENEGANDITEAPQEEKTVSTDAKTADAAIQETENSDQQENLNAEYSAGTAATENTQTAENTQVLEEQQFSQEADDRKIKKQETAASSGKVYENYMIKPGDTLYQISISHYGSTDAIAEICRLNNLTENQVIYPGQMIVLP